MPDLGKLGVPKYASGQPYHYEYDNVPLNTLAARDELINSTVDIHTSILQDTAGTQGTLANRLNQSIDADGNLKSTAIDQAMHNIAEHEDGNGVIDNPSALLTFVNEYYPAISNISAVPFVRMLDAERNKLALVAEDATNLVINVDVALPSTISTVQFGVEGNPTLNLIESDTIEWVYEAPDSIKADLKISTAFAHRHYYDLDPVTANFKDYDVTSVMTPFVEGSLRVYINGVRLSSSDQIYFPNSTHTAWSLNQIDTISHTTGEFSLLNAISSNDIIRVDFDVALT